MTTVIRRGTTGGAMSTSRKRRIASATALVVVGAMPIAASPPTPTAPSPGPSKAPKAPKPVKPARLPKGELAMAKVRADEARAALTPDERAMLDDWTQNGAPIARRVDALIDGATGEQRMIDVPKLKGESVVAGVKQAHLPEWTQGPAVALLHETRGVDYSRFTGDRAGKVRDAWEATCFYLGLLIEKEAYAEHWKERGYCGADGMGEIREELSKLLKVPTSDRTDDEIAEISRLKLVLARLEHAHEEPLRRARDLFVRRGVPADLAATHAPGLCEDCRCTSVLAPEPDAPQWIVDLWREKATKLANSRYTLLEADRRRALGHGNGTSIWSDHFRRMGPAVPNKPLKAHHPQRVHNDAHGPGQSWMRRGMRGGQQSRGIYS